MNAEALHLSNLFAEEDRLVSELEDVRRRIKEAVGVTSAGQTRKRALTREQRNALFDNLPRKK